MDPAIIGAIGVGVMLVLLALGTPIAIAMATVGIVGTAYVVGLPAAATQVMLLAWSKGTDVMLVCIPLELPIASIFAGVLPYSISDFALIVLMIAYPKIAVWLPYAMK